MEYIIIGLLVLIVILVTISLFKNINESNITERLGKLENNVTKELGEFKSDINGFGRYLLSDFTTNKQFNDFGWLNNYINTTFDVNVDTNVDSGFLLKKT